MNKLEELRSQLEAKKVEIRAFLDEKKADEAEKAMQEKRNLEKLISIEEEVEKTEKRELQEQKNNEKKEVMEMEKINEFRAIVKKVMGKELSVEERAVVKTTDNSAVIPSEFVNKLQEIKKGFGSIKEYTDVIPVTKNAGTIPVVNLDQNALLLVAEGAGIVDGTLVTTDVDFSCDKYGLIQSLSSELVDDAEVEIESLVNKNFAEIATAKENAEILSVIVANATAVTSPTSYEDLQLTMDTAVPAVKAGLITLTNVTGYAHLKNLKDTQDRPLNLVTEINGKYYFNGKELVVMDDAVLTPSVAGKQVFYTVNMKEAVKFIDRKAVTIARSTEAGFSDDTVKIRILERFDVVAGSARSIKKIEY